MPGLKLYRPHFGFASVYLALVREGTRGRPEGLRRKKGLVSPHLLPVPESIISENLHHSSSSSSFLQQQQSPICSFSNTCSAIFTVPLRGASGAPRSHTLQVPALELHLQLHLWSWGSASKLPSSTSLSFNNSIFFFVPLGLQMEAASSSCYLFDTLGSLFTPLWPSHQLYT